MCLVLFFRDLRVTFVPRVYQNWPYRDEYQRFPTLALAAFRVVLYIKVVSRYVLLFLLSAVAVVALDLVFPDVYVRVVARIQVRKVAPDVTTVPA